MRAILVRSFGGPEVLRLEDVASPSPSEGEVLIRVEAAGVNFIDIYHRTGLYPVALPFTPGQEVAGTVASVGKGVESVREGDMVAVQGISGGYADYVVAPADRVVVVGAGLDVRTAAALMLQGLTAHYLATSTYPIASGEWCLIHAAAGGVGLLLCQIAKMRGARVIGTVSTGAKASLAHGAGADEVITYSTHDFEAETKRITGEGVSVVYDSVGLTTFEKSLNCLRPRGMLVSFGQSSGAVPPIDPLVLSRKGSLFLTRPTLSHYVATRDELMQRAGDVFGWVREGKLSVRIDREFPLADASSAHRALEARRTTGKVLLIP